MDLGWGSSINTPSVLIVGGNIAGSDGVSKTRTLTTAIQLEARQGRYETAWSSVSYWSSSC